MMLSIFSALIALDCITKYVSRPIKIATVTTTAKVTFCIKMTTTSTTIAKQIHSKEVKLSSVSGRLKSKIKPSTSRLYLAYTFSFRLTIRSFLIRSR
ncbi:hypothetical protein D3C76_1728870 [compost metagenome]